MDERNAIVSFSSRARTPVMRIGPCAERRAREACCMRSDEFRMAETLRRAHDFHFQRGSEVA